LKKILYLLIIIFFCLNIFNNSNIINAYNQDDKNQNDKFSSDKYNYVIITSNELVDSLKSFEIWKSFLGYSVKTFTIQWILENHQGIDIQEKIKNFLIEKYNEFGIEYVLFVGSRDIIPMREVYTIPSEFEEGYGSLFTDYYYADINGDWDSDNDGLYGEYSHDDVDFYPEIYIGRIPCDDPELLNEIFKRNILYESDKGEWKKNVLLLGSILYYENLEANNHIYNRSDGATLMEECRTDIFEPMDFNCYRMYETEGLRPSTYDFDLPLNYSNVLTEWIKDYSIVNMVGHANQGSIARYIWHRDDGNNIPEINNNELLYRYFLQRSDSNRLFLEKPPFVFTCGCSQLRTSNNMGRSFIEDGAAIAFIGSTDFGLYNITKIWRDERDGGFFSLNYYFFNFFINDNQKCGEALFNSKSFFYDHFWFTNESNYEWIWRCYSTIFGVTLYGDPSLGLIYERKEIKKNNIQYLQFNFIFNKLAEILS
jgi:hypothetical protein